MTWLRGDLGRHLSLAAFPASVLVACGSSSTLPADQVTVSLSHVPSGTVAVLTTGPPTLTFRLVGLAPNSGHPAELVTAPCGSAGDALSEPLTVTADKHGVAEGSLAVTLVADAVRGLRSFRLHAGPGAASVDQRREISCAPLTAAPGGELQGRLRPGRDSQSAGTATLSYDLATRVLTVSVTVHGLAPGSVHPNHVHTGQCELQGPVRHVLKPLVADSHGDATATTEIPQVDRILRGIWYVAVHQGPGLDVPEEFSPIECGDVPN